MKFYNNKNKSCATHRGGAFSLFYVLLLSFVICAISLSMCVMYTYPVDVHAKENEITETETIEGEAIESEVMENEEIENEITKAEAPEKEVINDNVTGDLQGGEEIPVPPMAEISSEYTDEEVLIVKKRILHAHTGSEDGGGCYTIPREEYEQVEVWCSGTLHYWGDEWGTSECNVCGASYTGNRGGESCPHSHMETRTVTKYSIGCGRSGALVGNVTYRISPSEWTKEVNIDVEIENIGMRLAQKPYKFGGQSYTEGHFTVTENGKYSLGINADANSSVSMGNYTAVITNIDKTGPVLKKYTVIPSDWTRDGVDVIFDEAADLQPDGSEGCGLADEAYSYDNGNTYSTLASCHYKENGTYEFLIRDRLGNAKVNTVTVGNVDNEAPNIVKVIYDKTPNVRTVEVEIECNDLMQNGKEGCGLDDTPYSFDGGKTWNKEGRLLVDSNRTIEFCVRDRLGNIKSENIIIDNIDDEGPAVAHKITPDNWTNGDVTVIFSAKDINIRGESGAGLPVLCYSYDGGKTWTNSATVEVSYNRPVHIMVRDNNENYTYYHMDVNTIDRIPPSICFNIEYDEDGNHARLIADVTDNLSGVDIQTLNWSGQGKYSRTNYLDVDTEGNYTFSVCDKAGNSAENKVEVDEIQTPPGGDDGDGDGSVPEIIPSTPIPEIPDAVIPEIPEKGPDISSVKREEIAESIEEVVEEEQESTRMEDIRNADSTALTEQMVSNDDSGGIRGWWKGLSMFKRMLILLLLMLIIILLILILFLWSRSVMVLCDKNGAKGVNNELFLGIKYIRYKKGHYCIEIDEKMWNRAETTHFMFRFSLIFRLLHSGEDIYITFPGEQIRLAVISSKTDVNV